MHGDSAAQQGQEDLPIDSRLFEGPKQELDQTLKTKEKFRLGRMEVLDITAYFELRFCNVLFRILSVNKGSKASMYEWWLPYTIWYLYFLRSLSSCYFVLIIVVVIIIVAATLMLRSISHTAQNTFRLSC